MFLAELSKRSCLYVDLYFNRTRHVFPDFRILYILNYSKPNLPEELVVRWYLSIYVL